VGRLLLSPGGATQREFCGAKGPEKVVTVTAGKRKKNWGNDAEEETDKKKTQCTRGRYGLHYREEKNESGDRGGGSGEGKNKWLVFLKEDRRRANSTWGGKK